MNTMTWVDVMTGEAMPQAPKPPSVFNTTEWTTRDGWRIALEEMEPSHQEALLRFLRRRLRSIRWAVQNYWLLEVALHDGGEAAHDSLESELHAAIDSPDEEFFESLPLVCRLRELIAEEARA